MKLVLKAESKCLKLIVNDFEVVVHWHYGQSGLWWNETCILVMEVFGLPGDKYTYHPTIEHMIFLFNDEKDAILCRLLLSERL